MTDGWSFPGLGTVRRALKPSRRTRLTLELIGIAALAVSMGVGFGKLRQPIAPPAQGEPSEARALAVAPALAWVRPVEPPAAPEAATAPEPTASEPDATSFEPDAAPEAALSGVPPSHATRHWSRFRGRAVATRVAAPPSPAASEPAPAAPKPRSLDAWDTDGYGGRR